MTSKIVQTFAPPGRLEDFNEDQKPMWSQLISKMFDDAVRGYLQWPSSGPVEYYISNNAPRHQFFNPSKTDQVEDYTEKPISWIAFPKKINDESPTDKARWQKADLSRDYQDEYCEWSVSRNNDNKITSVTFTCEGPEYWQFLGKTSPDKVVELYRKHISPNIEKEHLFDTNGKYIPRNVWNRDTKNGAMHLIQQSNSLYAEVELAGGSSIIRTKNGKILEEQQALIECGSYGEPGRNSDPLIGAEVNALARMKANVSLRDPVGLYFDEFQPEGWETPDKSDPKLYWKILRGNTDTPVRAVYEVPDDKGFTVSDIGIKGIPITYGSQIADFVRIKLIGIAQDFGKNDVKPLGCVSYDAPQGMMGSVFSFEVSTPSQPAWRYIFNKK